MKKIVSITLDEVAIAKFNLIKKKQKYVDVTEFLNKMIDNQYEKLK